MIGRLRFEPNLEPQVIASIKRYRWRLLAQKLTGLAPLFIAFAGSLAGLVVAITLGEGFFEPSRGGASAVRMLAVLVPCLLVAALFLVAVFIHRRDVMPVSEEPPARLPGLPTFRDALEAVSTAVGTKPPELVALELPTANSISFLHMDNPAVGVTTAALRMDTTDSRAEALMAHELAHVMAGDIFLSTSRRRFRRIGYALDLMLVRPFVLLAFETGFALWLPFAFVAWTVFVVLWLNLKTTSLFRNSDLLADSIAAKITSDPGALKETIIDLGALMKGEQPFPAGARYPLYFFVNEATRPLVTLEERIRNIESIERGHWVEFETG